MTKRYYGESFSLQFGRTQGWSVWLDRRRWHSLPTRVLDVGCGLFWVTFRRVR